MATRKSSLKEHAGAFRVIHSRMRSQISSLPVVCAGKQAWHFATIAFAHETKSKLRWQQLRSLFRAIVNSRFTSRWFAMLSSPEFCTIATNRQRLYFKPFRVYMSIRWSRKQRVKVILDSYRMMAKSGALRTVAQGGSIELCQLNLKGDHGGRLILGYGEGFRKEGELVLSFSYAETEEPIVSAAFSFEEVDDKWVCRIGCIQGHKMDLEHSSRVAQCMMHGLRPKSLVLYAVQKFSKLCGCSAVYGAGDDIQAYRRKHLVYLPWLHGIAFDYDAFWIESGGVYQPDGWFILPFTPCRKDMSEIKANKRSSYRKRYQFMDDVSLRIAEGMKEIASITNHTS